MPIPTTSQIPYYSALESLLEEDHSKEELDELVWDIAMTPADHPECIWRLAHGWTPERFDTMPMPGGGAIQIVHMKKQVRRGDLLDRGVKILEDVRQQLRQAHAQETAKESGLILPPQSGVLGAALNHRRGR